MLKPVQSHSFPFAIKPHRLDQFVVADYVEYPQDGRFSSLDCKSLLCRRTHSLVGVVGAEFLFNTRKLPHELRVPRCFRAESENELQSGNRSNSPAN